MPESLTRIFFTQALNTNFLLHTEAGEIVELELIEVKDGISTPKQEQFSIMFRGPSGFILPQQTYSLEHDPIGAFDLFIVPVGRDPAGTYYEAVFNRFIQARKG